MDFAFLKIDSINGSCFQNREKLVETNIAIFHLYPIN